MIATEFRTQRKGPERDLEECLLDGIDTLFCDESSDFWTARSLPVGAGLPDIMIAQYRPQVTALESFEVKVANILAYLRTINSVTMQTVAEKLSQSLKKIAIALDALHSSDIVGLKDEKFSLRPLWRDILTEIITIEVKISDWKGAVNQANRNRIFAHRSYVAMPHNVAKRVEKEESFMASGVGLISVDDEGVSQILNNGRKNSTKVWSYYYKLAILTAKHAR
jgi:hypothetical protein